MWDCKNEWVCKCAWGEDRGSLEIVLFSQEPGWIICWQYILAEVSFHFKVNWKGKLNLIVPPLREEKGVEAAAGDRGNGVPPADGGTPAPLAGDVAGAGTLRLELC